MHASFSRRSTPFIIVALLLPLAALAFAAGKPGKTTAPAPEVVKARRFEVVDDSDRVRMRALVTPEGETRMEILDPQGRVRGEMALDADGNPRLCLRDEGNVPRAALFFKPKTGPGLELRDVQGRVRTILQAPPHGQVGLSLRDETEKPRVLLGVYDDDSASICVMDDAQLTKAGFYMSKQGQPGLGVARGEKVLWSAPMEEAK